MKLRISQLFILLISACGLSAQDFNKMVDDLLDESVALIQPDKLKEIQDKNSSIVLLDAREKEEYNVSHLENAIWVGYDDFNLSAINLPKNQEIVVYCSVGYRSEKVGEKLEMAGYSNVKNLYGGIFAWKNKGYPVFDNTNKETQKIHPYSDSWGKWLLIGEKAYE